MEQKKSQKPALKKSKIYFLSNYPPKECGIATFTQDLSIAMDKRFNPKLKSKVIALNEETDLYNYGSKVMMQIDKDNIDDYIDKAEKINKNPEIKLISIQHEFGLFGGEHGSYLIPFLEKIKKPVVITFHSVLPNPDKKRKRTVKSLAEKSSALIVMAKKAVSILSNDYDIKKEKIHVVRHGIPDISFQSSEKYKKKLGLQGRKVITTFGLLSRGKGIEYMIRAVKDLSEKYPGILYLVIGETHPVVRRKEGEKYRNELLKEVKKLGLKNNVKFYNKYVDLRTILDYLLASDIYVCTNLEKNQVVSGTLSYAVGCGKAVVSTPIMYSEEILSGEKGLLTEFKQPSSYVKSIDKIFSNPELKKRLERNAYSFGRKMIWSNVASRYLNIFNKAVKLREETTKKFPKIKLTHLKNLTDNFGVIQFANHSYPDKKSGYTVDDNSRALIVSTLYNNLFNSHFKLPRIYLNFLKQSQRENGNFKNNHENENEVHDAYSEDAFGRAIWSLGFALNKSRDLELQEKAKELFDNSFNYFDSLQFLRAKSFSVIGLCHYYQKYNDNTALFKARELAESLVKAYEKSTDGEWRWFEKKLTYSNSKLPEALFLVYNLTKNEKYLTIAEETLDFLTKTHFKKNKLIPVGQNGWFNKHGERALFDQQPVEASSMVQTYLTAYKITGKKKYYDKAILSFNWFLGRNHLGQMVYNENNGGCYDGVSHESVNLNQGAESTICYLIARLFLEEIEKK